MGGDDADVSVRERDAVERDPSEKLGRPGHPAVCCPVRSPCAYNRPREAIDEKRIVEGVERAPGLIRPGEAPIGCAQNR